MFIGSANEITITAIISPTSIKEPANKQIPPIITETKIEHSSYSSCNLDIFVLEPEKQSKNQIFYNKKVTCQTMNGKTNNGSEFELKTLQGVRF